MASLKSAAEHLKKSNRESIDNYQEMQPMERKNSEKRQSFAKRNLAINIPLDEFPKGQPKIGSPVHVIEQNSPPRRRDPSPEEEMQVIEEPVVEEVVRNPLLDLTAKAKVAAPVVVKQFNNSPMNRIGERNDTVIVRNDREDTVI